MSRKTLSTGSASRTPAHRTRRSFIAVAGAALSAPVAAAAGSGSWLPPSGGRPDSLEARLAELEDLNAIRALNQAYARHVTAGVHEELAAIVAEPSAALMEPDVRAISPEDYGGRDVIEIAPDRQAATARLHVSLHTETEIGPDCPLVDMARQQGGGVIRRAEPVVLEGVYVRRESGWKILRMAAVRA